MNNIYVLISVVLLFFSSADGRKFDMNSYNKNKASTSSSGWESLSLKEKIVQRENGFRSCLFWVNLE